MVLTLGGEEILLDEVYIYAKTTMEEYVQEYGESIWNTTIETEDGLATSAKELARREIIANIVETKALAAQAATYGIALTAEEEAEQVALAESFYSSLTDAQIELVNMQEDTALTVLLENALATKVYEYVMSDSSLDISDEQARMTTFYDMFFQCYYEDEYGNVVVYAADRIAEVKEKAQAAYTTISEQLAENPDFNITFLGYTYNLDYAGSHTLSQTEIVELYGQDVLNVLYSMSDGDISTVVETEYGYHIFQMTALTDATATAENKAEMSAQAEETYYANILATFTEALDASYSYSTSVDMAVYELIEFE